MRSSINPLKSVSLLLIGTLLAEQLAFAAPDFKPSQNRIFDKPSVDLRFPESVASVEDSWSAGPGSRTIYLFQDAHANLSGQANLSRALNHLMEKEAGLQWIFVEGGFGDSSLSFLREFASPDKRQAVADKYLKKGVLHGEEHLDLSSDRTMSLWGVEDPELYLKALEFYKKTAGDRGKFLVYLSAVEAAGESLKPTLLNPRLLALDRKIQSYIKNEISITDYFSVLESAAKEAGIDLGFFEQLSRFSKLREREALIDFKQAALEQTRAMSLLSEADRKEIADLAESASRSPFKVAGEDREGRAAYFAALRENLGARLSEFPMLSRYLDYLKEAKGVQVESILDELKALESKTIAALSWNAAETNLLQSSQITAFYRKLFELQVTPQEYREYRKLSASFGIEKAVGFINKKIVETGIAHDRALLIEKDFDEIVKTAESFYDLTLKRDEVMVRNMLAKLDEQAVAGEQAAAALITGGFHTANLKALLKEKRISFVSIRPQVFHETNQKRYEAKLLSQSLSRLSSLNRPAVSTLRDVELAANAAGFRMVAGELGAPQDIDGARLAKKGSANGISRTITRNYGKTTPLASVRRQDRQIAQTRSISVKAPARRPFFGGMRLAEEQKKNLALSILGAAPAVLVAATVLFVWIPALNQSGPQWAAHIQRINAEKAIVRTWAEYPANTAAGALIKREYRPMRIQHQQLISALALLKGSSNTRERIVNELWNTGKIAEIFGQEFAAPYTDSNSKHRELLDAVERLVSGARLAKSERTERMPRDWRLAILKGLGDEAYVVRAAVMDFMGETKLLPDVWIPALIRELTRNKHLWIKAKAAEALAQYREQAVPHLIDLLRKTDYQKQDIPLAEEMQGGVGGSYYVWLNAISALAQASQYDDASIEKVLDALEEAIAAQNFSFTRGLVSAISQMEIVGRPSPRIASVVSTALPIYKAHPGVRNEAQEALSKLRRAGARLSSEEEDYEDEFYRNGRRLILAVAFAFFALWFFTEGLSDLQRKWNDLVIPSAFTEQFSYRFSLTQAYDKFTYAPNQNALSFNPPSSDLASNKPFDMIPFDEFVYEFPINPVLQIEETMNLGLRFNQNPWYRWMIVEGVYEGEKDPRYLVQWNDGDASFRLRNSYSTVVTPATTWWGKELKTKGNLQKIRIRIASSNRAFGQPNRDLFDRLKPVVLIRGKKIAAAESGSRLAGKDDRKNAPVVRKQPRLNTVPRQDLVIRRALTQRVRAVEARRVPYETKDVEEQGARHARIRRVSGTEALLKVAILAVAALLSPKWTDNAGQSASKAPTSTVSRPKKVSSAPLEIERMSVDGSRVDIKLKRFQGSDSDIKYAAQSIRFNLSPAGSPADVRSWLQAMAGKDVKVLVNSSHPFLGGMYFTSQNSRIQPDGSVWVRVTQPLFKELYYTTFKIDLPSGAFPANLRIEASLERENGGARLTESRESSSKISWGSLLVRLKAMTILSLFSGYLANHSYQVLAGPIQVTSRIDLFLEAIRTAGLLGVLTVTAHSTAFTAGLALMTAVQMLNYGFSALFKEGSHAHISFRRISELDQISSKFFTAPMNKADSTFALLRTYALGGVLYPILAVAALAATGLNFVFIPKYEWRRTQRVDAMLQDLLGAVQSGNTNEPLHRFKQVLTRDRLIAQNPEYLAPFIPYLGSEVAKVREAAFEVVDLFHDFGGANAFNADNRAKVEALVREDLDEDDVYYAKRALQHFSNTGARLAGYIIGTIDTADEDISVRIRRDRQAGGVTRFWVYLKRGNDFPAVGSREFHLDGERLSKWSDGKILAYFRGRLETVAGQAEIEGEIEKIILIINSKQLDGLDIDGAEAAAAQYVIQREAVRLQALLDQIKPGLNSNEPSLVRVVLKWKNWRWSFYSVVSSSTHFSSGDPVRELWYRLNPVTGILTRVPWNEGFIARLYSDHANFFYPKRAQAIVAAYNAMQTGARLAASYQKGQTTAGELLHALSGGAKARLSLTLGQSRQKVELADLTNVYRVRVGSDSLLGPGQEWRLIDNSGFDLEEAQFSNVFQALEKSAPETPVTIWWGISFKDVVTAKQPIELMQVTTYVSRVTGALARLKEMGSPAHESWDEEFRYLSDSVRELSAMLRNGRIKHRDVRAIQSAFERIVRASLETLDGKETSIVDLFDESFFVELLSMAPFVVSADNEEAISSINQLFQFFNPEMQLYFFGDAIRIELDADPVIGQTISAVTLHELGSKAISTALYEIDDAHEASVLALDAPKANVQANTVSSTPMTVQEFRDMAKFPGRLDELSPEELSSLRLSADIPHSNYVNGFVINSPDLIRQLIFSHEPNSVIIRNLYSPADGSARILESVRTLAITEANSFEINEIITELVLRHSGAILGLGDEDGDELNPLVETMGDEDFSSKEELFDGKGLDPGLESRLRFVVSQIAKTRPLIGMPFPIRSVKISLTNSDGTRHEQVFDKNGYGYESHPVQYVWNHLNPGAQNYRLAYGFLPAQEGSEFYELVFDVYASGARLAEAPNKLGQSLDREIRKYRRGARAMGELDPKKDQELPIVIELHKKGDSVTRFFAHHPEAQHSRPGQAWVYGQYNPKSGQITLGRIKSEQPHVDLKSDAFKALDRVVTGRNVSELIQSNAPLNRILGLPDLDAGVQDPRSVVINIGESNIWSEKIAIAEKALLAGQIKVVLTAEGKVSLVAEPGFHEWRNSLPKPAAPVLAPPARPTSAVNPVLLRAVRVIAPAWVRTAAYRLNEAVVVLPFYGKSNVAQSYSLTIKLEDSNDGVKPVLNEGGPSAELLHPSGKITVKGEVSKELRQVIDYYNNQYTRRTGARLALRPMKPSELITKLEHKRTIRNTQTGAILAALPKGLYSLEASPYDGKISVTPNRKGGLPAGAVITVTFRAGKEQALVGRNILHVTDRTKGSIVQTSPISPYQRQGSDFAVAVLNRVLLKERVITDRYNAVVSKESTISGEGSVVTVKAILTPKSGARLAEGNIHFDGGDLKALQAFPLLRFYAGEIKDHRNRRISEIWAFSDAQFEGVHDFIQLLFPDKELGMFFAGNSAGGRNDAPNPVMGPSEQKIFNGDGVVSRKLRAQMIRSFERTLRFYGLELAEREGRIQVVEAANFNERAGEWLAYPNHNFLRITRVLKSLRLAGLASYSRAFYEALERINRTKSDVIDDSFAFWSDAVKDLPASSISPEQYAADRSAGARLASSNEIENRIAFLNGMLADTQNQGATGRRQEWQDELTQAEQDLIEARRRESGARLALASEGDLLVAADKNGIFEVLSASLDGRVEMQSYYVPGKKSVRYNRSQEEIRKLGLTIIPEGLTGHLAKEIRRFSAGDTFVLSAPDVNDRSILVDASPLRIGALFKGTLAQHRNFIRDVERQEKAIAVVHIHEKEGVASATITGNADYASEVVYLAVLLERKLGYRVTARQPFGLPRGARLADSIEPPLPKIWKDSGWLFRSGLIAFGVPAAAFLGSLGMLFLASRAGDAQDYGFWYRISKRTVEFLLAGFAWFFVARILDGIIHNMRSPKIVLDGRSVKISSANVSVNELIHQLGLSSDHVQVFYGRKPVGRELYDYRMDAGRAPIEIKTGARLATVGQLRAKVSELTLIPLIKHNALTAGDATALLSSGDKTGNFFRVAHLSNFETSPNIGRLAPNSNLYMVYWVTKGNENEPLFLLDIAGGPSMGLGAYPADPGVFNTHTLQEEVPSDIRGMNDLLRYFLTSAAVNNFAPLKDKNEIGFINGLGFVVSSKGGPELGQEILLDLEPSGARMATVGEDFKVQIATAKQFLGQIPVNEIKGWRLKRAIALVDALSGEHFSKQIEQAYHLNDLMDVLKTLHLAVYHLQLVRNSGVLSVDSTNSVSLAWSYLDRAEQGLGQLRLSAGARLARELDVKSLTLDKLVAFLEEPNRKLHIRIAEDNNDSSDIRIYFLGDLLVVLRPLPGAGEGFEVIVRSSVSTGTAGLDFSATVKENVFGGTSDKELRSRVKKALENIQKNGSYYDGLTANLPHNVLSSIQRRGILRDFKNAGLRLRPSADDFNDALTKLAEVQWRSNESYVKIFNQLRPNPSITTVVISPGLESIYLFAGKYRISVADNVVTLEPITKSAGGRLAVLSVTKALGLPDNSRDLAEGLIGRAVDPVPVITRGEDNQIFLIYFEATMGLPGSRAVYVNQKGEVGEIEDASTLKSSNFIEIKAKKIFLHTPSVMPVFYNRAKTVNVLSPDEAAEGSAAKHEEMIRALAKTFDKPGDQLIVPYSVARVLGREKLAELANELGYAGLAGTETTLIRVFDKEVLRGARLSKTRRFNPRDFSDGIVMRSEVPPVRRRSIRLSGETDSVHDLGQAILSVQDVPRDFLPNPGFLVWGGKGHLFSLIDRRNGQAASGRIVVQFGGYDESGLSLVIRQGEQVDHRRVDWHNSVKIGSDINIKFVGSTDNAKIAVMASGNYDIVLETQSKEFFGSVGKTAYLYHPSSGSDDPILSVTIQSFDQNGITLEVSQDGQTKAVLVRPESPTVLGSGMTARFNRATDIAKVTLDFPKGYVLRVVSSASEDHRSSELSKSVGARLGLDRFTPQDFAGKLGFLFKDLSSLRRQRNHVYHPAMRLMHAGQLDPSEQESILEGKGALSTAELNKINDGIRGQFDGNPSQYLARLSALFKARATDADYTEAVRFLSGDVLYRFVESIIQEKQGVLDRLLDALRSPRVQIREGAAGEWTISLPSEGGLAVRYRIQDQGDLKIVTPVYAKTEPGKRTRVYWYNGSPFFANQIQPRLKSNTGARFAGVDANTLIQRLKASRAIGIIPGNLGTDEVVRLAKLEIEKGLAVEIVLRAGLEEDVWSAVRQLRAEYPDADLAVGTLLTREQAQAAVEAGANILVTPGHMPEVAEVARARGVAYIPGVATPEEAAQALRDGATLLKYFPLFVLGLTHGERVKNFINEVTAPLPDAMRTMFSQFYGRATIRFAELDLDTQPQFDVANRPATYTEVYNYLKNMSTAEKIENVTFYLPGQWSFDGSEWKPAGWFSQILQQYPNAPIVTSAVAMKPEYVASIRTLHLNIAAAGIVVTDDTRIAQLAGARLATARQQLAEAIQVLRNTVALDELGVVRRAGGVITGLPRPTEVEKAEVQRLLEAVTGVHTTLGKLGTNPKTGEVSDVIVTLDALVKQASDLTQRASSNSQNQTAANFTLIGPALLAAYSAIRSYTAYVEQDEPVVLLNNKNVSVPQGDHTLAELLRYLGIARESVLIAKQGSGIIAADMYDTYKMDPRKMLIDITTRHLDKAGYPGETLEDLIARGARLSEISLSQLREALEKPRTGKNPIGLNYGLAQKRTTEDGVPHFMFDRDGISYDVIHLSPEKADHYLIVSQRPQIGRSSTWSKGHSIKRTQSNSILFDQVVGQLREEARMQSGSRVASELLVVGAGQANQFTPSEKPVVLFVDDDSQHESMMALELQARRGTAPFQADYVLAKDSESALKVLKSVNDAGLQSVVVLGGKIPSRIGLMATQQNTLEVYRLVQAMNQRPALIWAGGEEPIEALSEGNLARFQKPYLLKDLFNEIEAVLGARLTRDHLKLSAAAPKLGERIRVLSIEDENLRVAVQENLDELRSFFAILFNAHKGRQLDGESTAFGDSIYGIRRTGSQLELVFEGQAILTAEQRDLELRLTQVNRLGRNQKHAAWDGAERAALKHFQGVLRTANVKEISNDAIRGIDLQNVYEESIVLAGEFNADTFEALLDLHIRGALASNGKIYFKDFTFMEGDPSSDQARSLFEASQFAVNRKHAGRVLSQIDPGSQVVTYVLTQNPSNLKENQERMKERLGSNELAVIASISNTDAPFLHAAYYQAGLTSMAASGQLQKAGGLTVANNEFLEAINQSGLLAVFRHLMSDSSIQPNSVDVLRALKLAHENQLWFMIKRLTLVDDLVKALGARLAVSTSA